MYFQNFFPLACAQYPVQASFSTAKFSLDSTSTMKSKAQAFIFESPKQTCPTNAGQIHDNVDSFLPNHFQLFAEEMNLPETGAPGLNFGSFASDDHPEDWDACFVDIHIDVSDGAQPVQISSSKTREEKPIASADNSQNQIFEVLQSDPHSNQESIQSLQVDALEVKCANETVDVATVASAAAFSTTSFLSDTDIDTSEESLYGKISLVHRSHIARGERMYSRADSEGELPDSFVCAFSLEFHESEVGRLDIWVEEHGGEHIAKSLILVVPELKWVLECCPVLAKLSWNAEFWVLHIRVGETLEVLCRQEEFIPTWDEHLCGMLENFVYEVEQIVVREEFWVSEIWSKPEIITLGDVGIP